MTSSAERSATPQGNANTQRHDAPSEGQDAFSEQAANREKHADTAGCWRQWQEDWRHFHGQEKRWILFGTAVITALMVAVVLAGGFMTIRGAVIAPGRIVVDSYAKVVQHPYGGVVQQILVRNGSSVRAGDVLLQLDERPLQSEMQAVSALIDELMAEMARLQAERDELAEISFPEELVARASEPAVAVLLRRQRALMQVRRDALNSQVEILRQREAAIRKEMTGLQAELQGREKQLTYVREQLQAASFLLRKGHETRAKFLSLKSREAELEGTRGRILGLLAKARKKLGEVRLERLRLRTSHREKVLSRLSEVRAEIITLTGRRALLQDKLRHVAVRAPAAGKIHSMSVHTVGAVIKPGENILQVVPQHDELVVEARVRPQDVDQVHGGSGPGCISLLSTG